jgi:hypothetical protein
MPLVNVHKSDIPYVKAFMDELTALFEKHGMAIVPTSDGDISLHDPMEVVIFNSDVKQFIRRTMYENGW